MFSDRDITAVTLALVVSAISGFTDAFTDMGDKTAEGFFTAGLLFVSMMVFYTLCRKH